MNMIGIANKNANKGIKLIIKQKNTLEKSTSPIPPRVRDAQGAQRCETQWSNGAEAEPGAARRRERSKRRNARKKISCPRLPSCAKIIP